MGSTVPQVQRLLESFALDSPTRLERPFLGSFEESVSPLGYSNGKFSDAVTRPKAGLIGF